MNRLIKIIRIDRAAIRIFLILLDDRRTDVNPHIPCKTKIH